MDSKNSSDCQIGLGLRPRPIWQSSEFFSSNYFQIGQHVVLLHIQIKDLRGEEIKGSFYKLELLKAKQEVFRIDKVIRRDYKKKQALVKWKGYSDEFNSWIQFKDLKNI